MHAAYRNTNDHSIVIDVLHKNMCMWNWNGTLCVSHRTGLMLKYNNCILVYTIVHHLIAKQSEANVQACRHMFTKAP